jgi:hypothetical protein
MVWLDDYHGAIGSCSIYSIQRCFMANLGGFFSLSCLFFFSNSKLVRESPILNRVRKMTLTVVLNSGILVEFISRIL